MDGRTRVGRRFSRLGCSLRAVREDTGARVGVSSQPVVNRGGSLESQRQWEAPRAVLCWASLAGICISGRSLGLWHRGWVRGADGGRDPERPSKDSARNPGTRWPGGRVGSRAGEPQPREGGVGGGISSAESYLDADTEGVVQADPWVLLSRPEDRVALTCGQDARGGQGREG